MASSPRAAAHPDERPALGGGAPVQRIEATVYIVPTETPESDGTLEWDSTTLVLVEAQAAGRRGLGWSYTHDAAAALIRAPLAAAVLGLDALDVPAAQQAMRRVIRNYGQPGIAASAIAAVDVALWDLKARLLDVSLAGLLGRCRERVEVYGSGGFTSYGMDELQAHMAAWAAEGIPRVKMKVGRDARADVERVRAARAAIGDATELFVDANGAYDRQQALRQSERFAELGVTWFEEPVSSDDLAGLRLIRDRAPAGLEVSAGEYGYDAMYFRRMLDAGAVDVLQADATRCLGISGLLQAGALCEAAGIPLSTHTAPAIHVHGACALPSVRHVEYFFDHVRIERMFFDGVLEPSAGALEPDRSRPGLGLELKRSDVARFAV